MSEKVDEPLTESDKRQMWRMATFQCRCEEDDSICQKNGSHTFCKNCSFLLFRKSISHVVRCPSCNENEFWETIGFPCLACQFASITFRNPFQLWFKHQLQQWLNHNDSDSSEDEHYIVSKPRAHCLIQNEKDMLQYHNNAIE